MLSYTEHYFLKATVSGEPIGILEPASDWTEEFQDWEQKMDLNRPRKLTPSVGWHWLRAGKAEGKLMGGCLESLQHLRGTPYWPDWDNTIFFFETSEEKPSPATIDGILMDYEIMGVLQKLSGLIVGRPMYYSDEEKSQLDQHILERTRKFDFPIITNMDFGHTAPQFTLPIGCQAKIDSAKKHFEIIETAVI
ncbi:LD-carboxypeptidase [Acaryochloris sp. IP29b_bin.148]|uniref:LD-carboxypeptidase n=1 Tax=Acaryochloris sp. IP29b_bin.148 TaxID=2969218 RepID=UPI003454981A